MASTSLHEDIAAFLDDLATDLTNLHVKACTYLNEPSDPKAVAALAGIPAGLLDRAQSLRSRLDDERDEKPKAKAKPAASKR